MEIKLKNKMLFILLAQFIMYGCSGQELTKKQLDSIYSDRYKLYDNIKPSDVKINDLFTIDNPNEILKNLEIIFGKPDAYEEYGPFQDEGIDEIGYDYTYGCTDFSNCKMKRENNIPYNMISFSRYPQEKTKTFSYLSIELDRYKMKEFFLTIKGKKITVGNKIDDLMMLFPNTFKYYDLLSQHDYPVGFQVMIFSEYKKIHFGLNENNRIDKIEIEDLE